MPKSSSNPQVGYRVVALAGIGAPTVFDPSLGSICPYVKSKGVYVCPDDSSGQANSYSLSGVVSGAALSQFTQPASAILFDEESDGYQGSAEDGCDCFNIASGYSEGVTVRHNGGSVYVMSDEHAKYYLHSQIPIPTLPSSNPTYFL